VFRVSDKILCPIPAGSGVILLNMGHTDLELLARYTRHCVEDAFAEIVRRHLGLVYFAALRQVRSRQLAEEVAQSTFINLARHAHRLTSDTILPAWLYQVARRESVDVVRREARRQVREQVASEMNAINANAADWTHIEPLLDEAMHALDDTDRAAVLLRYFENKSLREVGATLGTTDDAARKRVNRAVECLREFFAKRAVTVGASGLTVVISANAIQAAPVGLAVTISTAAILTGTSAAVTATATVTKAIAMTTLQKSLIAATLAAAVGAGIYESRRASVANAKAEAIQRQHVSLTEQLARERDETARQLAGLRDGRERQDRGTAELLRLRGEVTRLKADLQALAQLKASSTNDQTLSEAVGWMNRVNQLKQYLEQSPAAKIPELQFVTEQDWLDAAKGKLNTDTDYRRALSAVRSAGESKVASMLKKALTKYLKAGNEQSLTDLSQLQPYFDSPLDDTVLQRWELAPAATVNNLRLGGDIIITQKTPVDDVFDTRYGIGPQGLGSTDFLSRATATTLTPVREAFRAAHNGQWPDNNSQLLPYATTPEQQAVLQKLLLHESASK
jgi:RNA polymerase sigma factor (sigma-70 family)